VTTEVSSASLTQAAKNSPQPVSLSRSQSQGDPKAIRAFAIELARLSSELKCEQVVLIDVRGRNQLCEYLVIVSGTSDRQMKAVSDQLKAYGAQHGSPRWKRDRDTNGTWIAADFVDVVVHLFEPGQRAWYDLEGMWADAPRVEWRRAVPAKTVHETVSSAKMAEAKSPLEMIAVVEASPKKTVIKKSVAKKASSKKVAGVKVSAKKPAAKKSAAQKPSAKKPVAKKSTAKKSAADKVAGKKTSAKKSAPAKSKPEKSKKKSVKKSSRR
jgi:ribosome-associated protein